VGNSPEVMSDANWFTELDDSSTIPVVPMING